MPKRSSNSRLSVAGMMAPAETQSRRLGKLRSGSLARRLQQIVEHRRHAGEVGEFAGLEQSHRFAGRELLHDVFARAGRQDAEHREIQRVGMKQRQRREHRVALAESPVIGAQQAATTHSMPCTVSSTPLARPVVPDV